MKKSADNNNDDIIQGLKNMIEEYEREQKLFYSTLDNRTLPNAFNVTNDGYGPENMFGLVTQLYKLPINGPSIREQIEGLKEKQLQMNDKREHFVQLQFNANASTIMNQLKSIAGQK